MKSIIKESYLRIAILIVCVFLYACKNPNQANEAPLINTTSNSSEKESDENIVNLSREQMKTVGIETGEIEQKQLSAILKTNGVLRVPNGNKANVTSMFSGVIQSIKVEIGDFVKKGQVIATISNPQFLQLQEEFLSINSQMAFANQEFSRQKELFEGNAGAKKNLEKATSDLKILQSRKSSLAKQIQMMGIKLSALSNTNLKTSLVVTSPISGTISEVFGKIGSYVDVSSPIAEIVENKALHLDLQVYEKDIPMIKIGQKVDFVVTNNPNITYAAQIYSIGSTFNGESKTIAIHSQILGNITGLMDGMNITGMVILDNVLSPAVPNDALVTEDGKNYIFVVKDNHQDDKTSHNDAKQNNHNEMLVSKNKTTFQKVEVIKGTSELGYTAIKTFIELPSDTKIVIKGSFFVNASLNADDQEGHSH